MASRSCTDEEFATAWRQSGCSPEGTARILGMELRSVYARRLRVERNLGIVLPAANDQTNRAKVSLPKRGYRHTLSGIVGHVIVFSDGHFWPGEERSTSFLALCSLIPELKPVVVIDNGDSFDGARISRHAPVDWANLPDVADELATVQERKGEILALATKANRDCLFATNMGNHDTRFSARLAQAAPDYVRVHGTDLPDHFPDWSFAWSTLINKSVMVKHRFKGGAHAAHNNAKDSGLTMVTGHLHKLLVSPWGDYKGRRWGVDTGTLSEFGPETDKFIYTEDNPLPWGEGFAVLTFDKRGKLLPPELVEVIDGNAYFRGSIIASKPKKAARTKRVPKQADLTLSP